MKALYPLLLLALASCAKEDVEVTYLITCDDCKATYNAGNGTEPRVDLNTFRYTTSTPVAKVMDTFSTTVTVREGDTPRITVERDSGYAFCSIRIGNDVTPLRVYGDVETLTAH